MTPHTPTPATVRGQMKGTTMAAQPTTSGNVSVSISGPVVRLEALDRAVRVSLSGGRMETDAKIVQRAETFRAFLASSAGESENAAASEG